MAEQRELEVTRRSVFGKQTKKLRREGKIPGNISGHGQEPIAVQFDSQVFDRLSHQSGFRSIVSLKGLGASVETVLVREVQLDPIKDKVLHVDFTRVSMHERIETVIPLHFVGEAPSVKLTGGVLLHLVEALPIVCSASDIVGAIEVDISTLTDFDAIIYAREVKLPANYTLNIDPEEPIVKVAAPRAAKASETETTQASSPTASTEAPATKS